MITTIERAERCCVCSEVLTTTSFRYDKKEIGFCSSACAVKRTRVAITNASKKCDGSLSVFLRRLRTLSSELPPDHPNLASLEMFEIRDAFIGFVRSTFGDMTTDHRKKRTGANAACSVFTLISDFAAQIRSGSSVGPISKDFGESSNYISPDQRKGVHRSKNFTYINELCTALVLLVNRKLIPLREACIPCTYEVLAEFKVGCTCSNPDPSKPCYLGRATRDIRQTISLMQHLPQPTFTYSELLKIVSIDSHVKYKLVTDPLDILSRAMGIRDISATVRTFGETLGHIADSNMKKRSISPYLDAVNKNEHLFVFNIEYKRMWVQTLGDFVRRLVDIQRSMSVRGSISIRQLWEAAPPASLPFLLTMKSNTIASASRPIWGNWHRVKSMYHAPLSVTPIDGSIVKVLRCNGKARLKGLIVKGCRNEKKSSSLILVDGKQHVATYIYLSTHRKVFSAINGSVRRLGGKTWIISRNIKKSEDELSEIDAGRPRCLAELKNIASGNTYRNKVLKYLPIEFYSFFDAVKLYREMRTMNKAAWDLKCGLLRTFPWEVVAPFAVRRCVEMAKFATGIKFQPEKSYIDFDTIDSIDYRALLTKPFKIYFGNFSQQEIDSVVEKAILNMPSLDVPTRKRQRIA